MKARSEPFAADTDDVDVRKRVQQLYRRHRDDVFRIAARYGRGNAAWAEDVTQDVFVTLCRKIDTLEDDDDLARWFYRVTHNRCLTRLRRSAATEARVVRWLLGRPDVDDGAQPERRTGLAEVFAVVDTLEPKQRIAFCMYYLDGLEQAEIGEMLGFSKSYVCKLIKRARLGLAAAGWELGDG